jgi:hypothetical protein
MQFLPAPFASSLLSPNIFLRSQFSGTLSLRCYLTVRDEVSQSCKTAGKIIFLYILKFTLFKSKREDRSFLTAWQQAFPELNLLLTSSWMQLLFVSIFSTYLRFIAFSKFCYLAINCEIVLNICSLHKMQDLSSITPLQSI